MKIRTGKGPIPLSALLAIWSVSAVASLPGLAVSPILGDMNRIFPHATDLEIQMLTSLPSLLVIPFVLLSGKISERRNKFTLLATGLALFFLSGVACLFAGSMTELIVISSLLGVGAGMVIPLSTGLVVDYFTGDYRVRQLGYSSAINNLTLVLATALAGYLANIEWHLPFLVYTLPGISFAAVFLLRRTPAAAEPPQSDQLKHTSIDWRKLAGVMALYFAITFLVLTVTYYVSFLVEARGLKDSLSGVLISLFFLAIMLPGFLLRRTIQLLRQRVNYAVGDASVRHVVDGHRDVFFLAAEVAADVHAALEAVLVTGCLLAGFGYGVMQPLIYDKAAIVGPPRTSTLALSLVMAMNYLAVVLCPFVMDPLEHLFGLVHLGGERFPFLFSAVVAALLAGAAWRWRDSFALGLDSSYYAKRQP